jgi:Lipid A 3-O-deacylase (PagL)
MNFLFFQKIKVNCSSMTQEWISKMGLRLALFLLMVGCVLLSTQPSFADDLRLRSVGIRGAFDIPEVNIFRLNFDNATANSVNFQQYDMTMVFDLPWGWHLPYLYCNADQGESCSSSLESGWEVRFLANGSAGLLRGGGSTGFISTIGPGIALRKPSWRVGIDLGGGWAFLSDYTFGAQDLGGPIQFIGHLGISVDLGWNLLGTFRFHHMSDAGMYGDDNRGIDFYMFELAYKFNIPLLQ